MRGAPASVAGSSSGPRADKPMLMIARPVWRLAAAAALALACAALIAAGTVTDSWLTYRSTTSGVTTRFRVGLYRECSQSYVSDPSAVPTPAAGEATDWTPPASPYGLVRNPLDTDDGVRRLAEASGSTDSTDSQVFVSAAVRREAVTRTRGRGQSQGLGQGRVQGMNPSAGQSSPAAYSETCRFLPFYCAPGNSACRALQTAQAFAVMSVLCAVAGSITLCAITGTCCGDVPPDVPRRVGYVLCAAASVFGLVATVAYAAVFDPQRQRPDFGGGWGASFALFTTGWVALTPSLLCTAVAWHRYQRRVSAGTANPPTPMTTAAMAAARSVAVELPVVTSAPADGGAEVELTPAASPPPGAGLRAA